MNLKILQQLGLEEVAIDAGTVILHKGKSQQKVYVLIDGHVGVNAGDHEIADVDATGTVFGEIAALLGTEHVADVVTKERSSFYVVEDFRRFLQEHADAALSVAQVLACRLINMNNHLVAVKDQLATLQTNLEDYVPVFPENFQPG